MDVNKKISLIIFLIFADLIILYYQPKGISAFQYPLSLPTQYIHAVDWPPKIQLFAEIFSCKNSGNKISPNGQTQEITVNGNIYCAAKESEGAAGSIYTNYSYKFAAGSQTADITFTLRAVQCDNYDDPQKTACKEERLSFNPDTLADQMAESIK